MRILIVDDEPVLRELFSDFFTMKGHEVETANDGVEGLNAFRTAELPFEAVLSDYQMPRMNGVLMLQAILELSPETRVVLASANPPDIRKYLPETVKVLRKPFSNHELLGAFE